MGNAVDAWMDAQSPQARAGIDALRAILRRAGPTLDETIKWNDPSYADAGADRVTPGLDRKLLHGGGFRVVIRAGWRPGPRPTGAWSCSRMRRP